MEWFKHFTGSHDDPDLSDGWDLFGDPAIVIFWVMLEIYGKEFKNLDKNNYLKLSIRYFERKIRRKCKKVERILEFFEKRGRIYFKIEADIIWYKIPKFIEVSSNWTKRKKQLPMEAPTEAPTAREEEEEEEEKEEEEEEEKEEEEEEEKEEEEKVNLRCPHKKIVKLWNDQMTPLGLPIIQVWGPDRQAHLKARWEEENKRQKVEWWKGLFEFIVKSDFLMGKVDPNPGYKRFKVSLPWIIQSSNKLAEITEGKYVNRD